MMVTLRWRGLLRAAFLFLFALPVALWAQGTIPTLTVDPQTPYAVNGVQEIQAVAGVVVNGESRLAHVNETRALNIPATRLYLWVANSFLGRLPKTLSPEEKLAQFFAQDMDKLVHDAFVEGLKIDSDTGQHRGQCSAQFWQLEQLEAWGSRQNVILQILQPHPRTEADFAPLCRYYRAVLREVKTRYPDLDTRYVMVFNEPDYEYPRSWEKRSQAESVKFFYTLYNMLQADIHKEFPAVTLLGPSISRFMGWVDWQAWTLPFLQQAPQATLFNCQPYTATFTDLLAWTSMLQATSLKLNGHRIPLVATEHNVDLNKPASDWWKDVYHAKRVHDEADILFGMLEHPDQFAIKTYFYYHYTNTWSDMWFAHDGVVESAPTYWLYWTMRDVRGTRLYSALDREADRGVVRSIAARDGHELTLALYNGGDTVKTVRLNVLWPKGFCASAAIIDSLSYDPAKQQFSHNTAMAIPAPASISLAPGEVKKLRWAMPTRLDATPALQEQEYFAGDTAVTVSGTEKTLTIPARAAKGTETVFVRAAVYVDDVLATERIDWTVNGHECSQPFVPVKGAQPIAYIESALPAAWVQAANTVVFAPVPDAPYRVMFASLVYRPQPVTAPPFVLAPNSGADAPVRLTLAMPATVVPGPVTLTVNAVNSGAQAMRGPLRVTLPEGWSVANTLPTLTVPAKGAGKAALALNVPAGQMRGDQFLTVTFTPEGGAPISARRGASYQPPLVAAYAQKPLVIDGKLDDWAGTPISMRQEGPDVATPYQTLSRFMWDGTHLYLAMEVKGRKLRAVPVGKSFWAYDTLEVFLDFFNSKRTLRNNKMMQVYVVAKDEATGVSSWGNCPNDPNGVFLATTKPATYQAAVTETADGFVLETALDWQSMVASQWTPVPEQFTPKAGALLGCELALENRSTVGGVTKAYSDPSRWGVLRLAAPGEVLPNEPLEITPAQPALAVFTPENITDWAFPVTAVRNAAGLHLVNNQQMLTWRKSFPNFLTDAGITTSITLNGVKKLPPPATAPQEAFVTHARAFWTTDKMEGFIEPYTMQNTWLLLVEYRDDTTSLTLYRKERGKAGYGTPLWSGRLAAGAFPATVSVWMNARDYRVRLDKPVETLSGSLAGPHGADATLWAQPIHFGIKAEYGPLPGAVLIPQIVIRNGK